MTTTRRRPRPPRWLTFRPNVQPARYRRVLMVLLTRRSSASRCPHPALAFRLWPGWVVAPTRLLRQAAAAGGQAGDLLGRRQVFIGGLLLFRRVAGGGFAPSRAGSTRPARCGSRRSDNRRSRARAEIRDHLPEGPPGTGRGRLRRDERRGSAVGLIAEGLLTTCLVAVGAVRQRADRLAAALPCGASRVSAQRGRFDCRARHRHRRAGRAGLWAGNADTPDGVSHWETPRS